MGGFEGVLFFLLVAEDANLHICIENDGRGGADSRKGSGLIGLRDASRRSAPDGCSSHAEKSGGDSLSSKIPIRTVNRHGGKN